MKYVSSDNVVIGEQSIIQERSIIRPNIRIWPGKTLNHSRSLTEASFIPFGIPSPIPNGLISGTINVDITPEFASRLGSALGPFLAEETAWLFHRIYPAHIICSNMR